MNFRFNDNTLFPEIKYEGEKLNDFSMKMLESLWTKDSKGCKAIIPSSMFKTDSKI